MLKPGRGVGSIPNTPSFWVDPSFAITVACEGGCSYCDPMRPRPKGCRKRKGIQSLALPPGTLITAPVQLAMVQPADGNCEAVADLAAHRPLLGKPDVMGIRGGPAAHKTPLSSHKLQMVAIALSYRFADDGDFLGAGLGTLSSEDMSFLLSHLVDLRRR